MLDQIALCCANHLRTFIKGDPTFSLQAEGEQISVTLGEDDDQQFTIIVDDRIDNGGEEVGVAIQPGRSFVKIIDGDTDHGDILDACLDALAQDTNLQPLIADLTTDGDNSDCEAIFRVEGYGYVILKVR